MNTSIFWTQMGHLLAWNPRELNYYSTKERKLGLHHKLSVYSTHQSMTTQADWPIHVWKEFLNGLGPSWPSLDSKPYLGAFYKFLRSFTAYYKRSSRHEDIRARNQDWILAIHNYKTLSWLVGVVQFLLPLASFDSCLTFTLTITL